MLPGLGTRGRSPGAQEPRALVHASGLLWTAEYRHSGCPLWGTELSSLSLGVESHPPLLCGGGVPFLGPQAILTPEPSLFLVFIF